MQHLTIKDSRQFTCNYYIRYMCVRGCVCTVLAAHPFLKRRNVYSPYPLNTKSSPINGEMEGSPQMAATRVNSVIHVRSITLWKQYTLWTKKLQGERKFINRANKLDKLASVCFHRAKKWCQIAMKLSIDLLKFPGKPLKSKASWNGLGKYQPRGRATLFYPCGITHQISR